MKDKFCFETLWNYLKRHKAMNFLCLSILPELKDKNKINNYQGNKYFSYA